MWSRIGGFRIVVWALGGSFLGFFDYFFRDFLYNWLWRSVGVFEFIWVACLFSFFW